MTGPRVERRRSRRQRTVREHRIESARVRRSVHVDIIDISAGGVLVETHHRLLPGMPLDVHFEREKRISTIRGRVLRCVVVRLTANAVSYRGAIGFDGQLPWFGEDAVAGSSFTTAEGQ